MVDQQLILAEEDEEVTWIFPRSANVWWSMSSLAQKYPGLETVNDACHASHLRCKQSQKHAGLNHDGPLQRPKICCQLHCTRPYPRCGWVMTLKHGMRCTLGARKVLGLQQLRCTVDAFHARGRVGEWCKAHLIPDLPVNKEKLAGFPTTMAEVVRPFLPWGIPFATNDFVAKSVAARVTT